MQKVDRELKESPPSGLSDLKNGSLKAHFLSTPRKNNPVESFYSSIEMSGIASKVLPRTNNGTGAFVLQCRKMVFNYCEKWGSNKGMM